MTSERYPQTGSQLDRYEVIAEIGRGGMGVVYRAYEATLDRVIALKRLSPNLAHQPGFVARLRREAISAARLRHPNIALLYEFGQTDDTAFLAMEYVPGLSLRQLLESGPLTLDRTLHILSQIGSALDYAHRIGIIHRDVKPSNILVGPGDHAVLIDFGLADMAENAQLTIDSAVLGTPHYMSPEQAAGHSVDARSDQYALAAVAYEMLTGVPPFHGRSATAVVHAHIYEPPAPPTECRPTLPVAVNDVLLRGLSKSPYQRYASLAAMIDDLRAALVAPAFPQRSAPRRRWLLGALGGLALLAVVAVILLMSGVLGDSAHPDRDGGQFPLPQQVIWSYTPNLAGGPALVELNGTIVAGTLDGTLIGLRADSGDQRWNKGGGDTIFGAPSAGKDLLFAGSADGYVFGLSPGSGGTIWQTQVIGAVQLAPVLDGDRLIVTTARGYIYVLQAGNGQVIWSRPLEQTTQAVTTGAGRIFVSAGRTLFALSASNGAVDWTFDAASTITTRPAILGGRVLVGTERGLLYALYLANGREQMRYQAHGPLAAAPASSPDTFFVVDQGGSVTAFSPGSTATELWRFNAGAAIEATPLLIDDKLFFGAGNGVFYILDARTGEVLTRLQLGGSISTAPILHDGTVYVRADRVYALGS